MLKICHWEITKRCNLSCLHCISCVGSRKELNRRSALMVVDKLKDWGCQEINFTGGEPLNREDMFDILEKAKKSRMKVNLLSNGILINNKNVNQVKKYVDNIGISLDGASAKINDRIRGRGTFRKIIDALNLLQKYKISITLYITLCKLNIDDFENILKLSKSLKINNIRVNEITLRGRAYNNRNMFGFNKAKQLGLRQYLLNILKKNGYCDKDFLIDSSCEIDNKNIFISPLGYIYLCIEIYQQRPNYHLGNILEVDKGDFELQRSRQIKLKPKSCPYQFIAKENFALCLNNSLIKCGYEC